MPGVQREEGRARSNLNQKAEVENFGKKNLLSEQSAMEGGLTKGGKFESAANVPKSFVQASNLASKEKWVDE